MSGLYHGHLVEYPRIRVDHFSTVKDNSIPLPDAARNPDVSGPQYFPIASLYLLSHCHTVSGHESRCEGVEAPPWRVSSSSLSRPVMLSQDHTQGLDSVTGGLHIICSQEVRPPPGTLTCLRSSFT